MKTKTIENKTFDLTSKYSWSFGESYSSYGSFVESFIDYNRDISNIEVEDFEINSVDKIIIEYRGIMNNDYCDLHLTLECETGKISFLELMFRFNQATLNEFEDADHRYFEGYKFKNYLYRELGLVLRTGS